MALDKVKKYFKKYNMESRIIEFNSSSATVDEAAQCLNCEGKRIAKSLTFMLNDGPIMIVMAGDAKVDNGKFKEYFHEKANMLKFEDVESLIGHAVGGVCPFAINDNVKVYLDISLKRFDTVFPACGSDNSAIELNINELERYSNYIEWIDIGKNWE